MTPLAFHRLRPVRLVGWSIAGTGAQVLFGGIVTVVLARALEPAGLGLMGVFIAISLLLSQVGELGLGTAYVRIASPRFKANLNIRALTWNFLYVRLTAVTLLSAVAILLVRSRPSGSGGVADVMIPAAIAAVLLAVASHYTEVLRARLLHRSAAVARTVMSGVRAIVYGAMMLNGTLDPRSAVAAYVLIAAAEAVTLVWLGQQGASNWPPAAVRIERNWMTLSWWLFLASASSVLLIQTDTIMIATLGGPFETGLWVAASRLIAPAPLLLAAIWSVVLPVSVAFTDPATIARYLRVCRRTSAASLVLGAVGVILVPPFLRLLFGAEYAGASGAAMWLILAFGISGTAVMYGGLIHLLRLERPLAALNVMLLLVNAAGDFLVIPRFGAAGCGAVTALVLTVSSAWAMWRVESSRAQLMGAGVPPRVLTPQSARSPHGSPA
ncbi:MAG TPA: oligosaccharide flippase family protein [Longimicrobiales bacterium]|nr:oligosaccharide flippase family protein [Longimicrobiales bacterium]